MLIGQHGFRIDKGIAMQTTPQIPNRLIRAELRREIERGEREPSWWLFTERERQIISLLSSGLSNAEIGDALFIAPDTVKNHLIRVYAALDLDAASPSAKRVLLARWYWETIEAPYAAKM